MPSWLHNNNQNRMGGVDMTKDRIISAMSNFCPPIIGECPKCGEPIFEGYRCLRCGLDASTQKIKNIEWEE